MKNNNKIWLKLDNAAKVFPYISNGKASNVFRISFTLKNQIDSNILQQALDDLKPRFPTFFVKMKRGFFWFYFEQNERKLEVKQENPFICSYKNSTLNKGYFLDVFYYNNRISFEIFHSISDASGGSNFALAVVYRYLELLDYKLEDPNNLIIHYNSEIHSLELKDSFNRYYTNEKLPRFTPTKAYRIKGKSFSIKGNGVITGLINQDELYKVSKKYNCTITQFICACMFKSIMNYSKRFKNKKNLPINIILPVNLRKYFDSLSLRNFSLYIYLSLKHDLSLSLNDIIDSIKKDYDKQLNIENLQATLNANVGLEKIYLLKFLPLILKTFAFKVGFDSIAGGLSTISISNLGKLNVPECLFNHIDHVDFINGVGTDTTHNLGIVSFNKTTSISISRVIKETEIEQYFFNLLTDEGLQIKIESNLWEDN